MKINGHIIKPKADLRRAHLRGAHLCGADLHKADLRGANLDLSVFPLWCGSFGLKTDTRLVWQLIAHITRLDTSKTSKKAKEAIKALMPYANDFCRYRKDVDKI